MCARLRKTDQHNRDWREDGEGASGCLLSEELVVEREENDKQAETELHTGLCPLHSNSWMGEGMGE